MYSSILCWQICSWLPAVLAAHAGCSYPGWQCKLDFSWFLFVFAFCCRLCGPHKYTYTHLGWQCKLDLIFHLIFVHGKFIHKLRKTLRWNFLDGEMGRIDSLAEPRFKLHCTGSPVCNGWHSVWWYSKLIFQSHTLHWELRQFGFNSQSVFCHIMIVKPWVPQYLRYLNILGTSGTLVPWYSSIYML